MAKNTGTTKATVVKNANGRPAPGKTIESRESQIIMMAYDLVEERIRNGTATSQEVTHFLKMGSSQAQLEKVKLENENKLLEAKTEALESQKKIEELYAEAIRSMAIYQGHGDEND